MINSRFLDGMTPKPRNEVARLARRYDRAAVRRASARCSSACATGAFRASATGAARSRSSIARCGVGAGAGEGPAGRTARRRHLRQAGQSARPPSDLEARRLPAMRQGGAARDRHDGHVRRFVLVFRPLHRSVERDEPTTSRSTAERAGCRSTSISAASSTRSCTCSIRASSPAR
jgi:hypothetical protein